MPIEKAHRRLLLAVCTALFFMPFMMAGVNAVLPPLGESLHASARQLGMVGAFYSLGLAVFQLAAGSLGDICGRRRIFLWGMAIFALAGAALGFVSSMPLFLALRFVQGLGGALFNAGRSGPAGLGPRRRASARAISASAARPCMRALPAGRRWRVLLPVGSVGVGCSGAMPWRRSAPFAHEVLRQSGMAHSRGPAL